MFDYNTKNNIRTNTYYRYTCKQFFVLTYLFI